MRREDAIPDIWEFVRHCEWGVLDQPPPSGSTNHILLVRARTILATYSPQEQQQLHAAFREYHTQLHECLLPFAIRGELPIRGDNDFYDLCAHVIGCGKSSFDAVIADPATSTQLSECPESFAHVFEDLPVQSMC